MEGIKRMETCSEYFGEKEACAANDCRHAAALRDIICAVRKLSHELSQPIMLLEGHLELLMLVKCTLDKDSVDRFIDIVRKQMEALHLLHTRLRAIVAPAQG